MRALVCCVLVACASDRLDPSELELRDVLGIAPEMASTWNAEQRAAARHVIDEGLHAEAKPMQIALGKGIPTALATADNERANRGEPALGVIALDGDRATPKKSALASRANPVFLQFSGWTDPSLPARGLDVLSTIAADAGHTVGPVVVTPAPQLAVIASYLPSTSKLPATLLVNPILLESLEPTLPATAPSNVALVDTVGNPYTFYKSIAECANVQRTTCEACLGGACPKIDGHSCTELAAGDGRGYSLVCIDLALSIESVVTCTVALAPSTCPLEAHTAQLEANGDFLDKPECVTPLDRCLSGTYGSGTTTQPTPVSSPDCSNSACDAEPSCDGSCSDTGDNSSCDSGDSGDSCDSGDSGGDCSSSDGGGDCSGGDSGGGCSDSGGGDCSGDSGGDCSGGGGDCASSGGDCDAAGQHRHSHGYLWALLPVPFAIIARRKADRRRARAVAL